LPLSGHDQPLCDLEGEFGAMSLADQRQRRIKPGGDAG